MVKRGNLIFFFLPPLKSMEETNTYIRWGEKEKKQYSQETSLQFDVPFENS